MKVGFVGLGNMGSVMAVRIARAGHDVTGYDIDAARAQRVAGEGVRIASALPELARSCELVLSMVWDDAALRDAAAQVLPSLRGVFIDLSTTSVSVVRDIAAGAPAEATVLDGSVMGGGVPAAREGRSPMAFGGDREAFERCRAVLEVLGSCDHVGALGAAKAAKIVNNQLVGVMTAANAEVLSLGVAAGLDLPLMVELLGHGPAGTHVMRSYMGNFVAKGRYSDGLIGHKLMAKDLSLACNLAVETGACVPCAETAQQMYFAFGRALGADAAFPSAFEFHRTFNTQPRLPAQPAANDFRRTT
jgi:3-hydroxyisobutyrate dehydrogenase